MPQFTQCKMCAECPFRKDALPGWLGPHTIEDFEEIVRADHDFICHTEVARMKRLNHSDETIESLGQHCVGTLRYMNSVAKLSRDAEKAAAQKRLREIEDQPLIPPFKFREHHEFFLKKDTEKKPKKGTRNAKRTRTRRTGN